MKEFFHEMPYFAWSLVAVMIALTVIASKWEEVKWWAHNTWYSFPFIGRIASLSKNTKRDSTNKDWFVSEKTLCQDYKKFVRIQNEHEFMENVKYLTLAGDDGRTPTPFLIWVLICSLVIVEAMGFSYVLAGYTLPGASENLQETGALGIAFLISVILVVLTHAAGHELYKSGKIRQARRDWLDLNNGAGKFHTMPVSLAVPQNVDEGEPFYVRLTNRVGNRPTSVMCWVALIFVLIVAVGATFVRGQVLEKQLQDTVTSRTSEPPPTTIKIGPDGLSFNTASKSITLPAADVQENKKADDKAALDERDIDRKGGWGTFIVLAFVFIFLQIIGVYFGHRWGFAGKFSFSAYTNTGGYTRYEDILERYDEVADVAQAKLSDMQQRLMARNAESGNAGVHTSLTFKEFMRIQRNEKDAERLHQQQSMDQLQEVQRNRQSGYGLNNLQTQSTEQSIANPFDKAMMELEGIADKEARKNYVLGLTEPLKSNVIAELKRRKEEQEKQIALKQNEELDGLL